MVGPSVRQLAALAAVAALAAAGGQAAWAAGIGVVGGAQATLDAPGMGQFVDIDFFETPDGHSYLLALRYDRIYTIDVTFRPVRAGGITHDQLAGSWFWNAETFRTPDGRVYAAVTGDHFSILDVTDPANPETVYGVPEGADNASPFGDAWQVTVYERPDGRVHALVTGGNNALQAVDITDPYNPVALGGGPDLVPPIALGSSATLYEPGDGRIYVMYGSIRMGVSIVDVTDPARPVLVSAIRHYDGDHPLGYEDYFQAHGIPAPSSSDVLIADGYAEGLGYANEVAVFGLPDGRTYAMVANGMAAIQVQSPGVGREPPQYDMVANGTAPIQVQSPGVGREPPQYDMVANDTAPVQIDEPDTYIVPAGIIFLDVTDPHAPAPAGAILYGEDGFDFGSGIRDTAIRGGPVSFPEGHRIDIGYPIRDIAILDSPDGRVHAAVAGDRGMTILDVTDPAGPILLSHIRDGEDGFDHIDTVRGMDVVESPGGGTHLAMAGDEGVQMADVTDPGEPVGVGSILGRSVNFANPVIFESGDGRIYAMGLSWDTVSMVEITDPSLPVPLGSIRDGEGGFDTLDGVRQVEALHTPDGRIYAMAAGGEGLQVIEVTDPHSPAAVGILRNGTDGFEVGRLISTAVLQQPGGRDYFLVADHDRGVYTVDVTDPRAPALAGSLRGGEGGIDLLGGVHDMDVFGGPDGRPYALMTGDVGIHTIDMADPTTPVVAGTLDGSISGAVGGHTLTLIHQSVVFESASGRIHALLADYTSGIHIIDLTDPRAPAYMGSAPAGEGGVEVIPGSAVAAVTFPDGRAYALVTGWDDIQILDITDPYAPAPAGAIPAGEGGLGLERTPWYIITMEPAGDRIHALASGGDRLWVLDVTYPVPPEVSRVDSWDGEGGLVSSSGSLGEVVGSVQAVLDEPGVGPLSNVAAFEAPDGRPYLVVVGDSETVWVVDVADPHRPALAGAVSDRWFADTWRKDVETFEWPGGHVYAVASGNGEARILNVTDPRRPALVGNMMGGSLAPANLMGVDDTALFGTPDGRVHALALGWDFGLTVVDMTDPRWPTPAEWLENLDIRPDRSASAVLGSSGGRVYAVAVGGAADVYIMDVTDPHRPALASVVKYAGDPSADAGARQGPAGGSAATVIIPLSQIDTPPEHTEIRISGTNGAGLLGASGVAIMEAPGGRVYAAVSNYNIASGEAHPQGIPAGILFIDITDPSRPVPAGAVRDGEGGFEIGSIGDMAVLEAPGGSAYMAVTGPGGLHMLDVTDPTKPVPAGAARDGEGGFYNIGSAGMAVIGPSGDGRLYLATVGDGIQLVDVTDPSRPVPAGAIPDTPGSFYATGGAEYTAAFSLVGRTYALGTGGDGVHILDVTDPSRPVPAGSAWDGRDGFDTLDAAHHIAVTEYPGGPFLALVAGDEGIQILDIVNPSRPVPAGAIRYGEDGLDPRWVTDMEAYRSPAGRDYLLVAGHYTGIHMVDVTDPSQPVLVGGAAPAGDGTGLRGGCPGEGHLGKDSPDPLDGIHGVDVYTADGRDYALVTCDGGIRTLDLSDPAAPRLAGALPDGMNNHTFGTIYWAVLYEPPGGGIYALLAAYYGGSGIHIVDVTDPNRPAPAGSIPEDVFAPIPGTPVRVVASGDRVLALGSGTGGIHILDVTDPHHPAHTGFLPAAGMGLPPDSFPWYITPFESGEGKAYALVDGWEGALILNISPHPPDGGDGTVVDMAGSGGVPAPDGGRALALVGAGGTVHVGGPGGTIGFEYILPPVGADGTVAIVDLTDPYAPFTVGTVPSTYGQTGGIEVVYSPEGHAYAVAIGPAGGLLVTDIAGPHATSTFTAGGLALAPDSPIEIFRPHDGRAYMAAGDDGVRFVDVTHPTGPVQVSHIRDNLDGFYHLDGVRDISVFESGDGLVYALAGGGDGIQIIDVTNPYRPSSAGGMHKFLGDHSADGVHRTATVRTSDGVVLALAAGGAGRTAILDVTDPRSPVLAGTICAGIVGYENATGMWTAGECNTSTEYLAYVPVVAVFETSDGRIRALIAGPADSSILDITDPAAPVQVVTVAGHGALDIISVFESPGGRPNVLLAGDGDIWVGDLDDLTRLHVWGWP